MILQMDVEVMRLSGAKWQFCSGDDQQLVKYNSSLFLVDGLTQQNNPLISFGFVYDQFFGFIAPADQFIEHKNIVVILGYLFAHFHVNCFSLLLLKSVIMDNIEDKRLFKFAFNEKLFIFNGISFDDHLKFTQNLLLVPVLADIQFDQNTNFLSVPQLSLIIREILGLLHDKLKMLIIQPFKIIFLNNGKIFLMIRYYFGVDAA